MTNYNELKDSSVISSAVKNLTDHGFLPEVVKTKEEALEKIKSLIPQGASVINGASRTLEQIGYIEYLKGGQHGWNNLQENILKEQDKAKQALLRKQSVITDFYLGSAHAISQTGEILVASNTGSQMSQLAFTASNIVLVVSTKKIADDMTDAMRRVEEHVVPLEDDRMMKAANVHTMFSKLLILRRENAMMGRKVHVLFVEEDLGF